MKCRLLELDGCFLLNLDAETAEETSQLARLSMNATQKISWSETKFSRKGGVTNRTRIEKRKNVKDTINKDS